MLNTRLARIGWILIALLTIVFGIKNVIEPDLWWQLSAGDRILQNGKLLFNDPFTYTFPDARWINIKWVTEILMVSWVKIASPQLLPLFQILISLAIVYTLISTARLFNEQIGSRAEHVAILIGIGVFLLMSQYRMNSRPEMFSHLFTAGAVYLYTRYNLKQGKFIYWLVPIQFLWSNMHDGYAIGLALILSYTLYKWIVYFISDNIEKPMQITYVLLLVLLATGINPNGYLLLYHWINIYGQFTGFQFTTEFLDYRSYQFWTAESYMAFGVFLLVLLDYMFRIFRVITPELDWEFLKKLMKSDLILPLGFMGIFCVFGLMGYRNVIYLSIVAIPHFIYVCETVILKMKPKLLKITHVTILLLLVTLSFGVVSNTYYTIINSRSRFGFEVSSFHHPYTTAKFLQSKSYKGNIFSDYLSSAFFLWELRPDFKVWIDLRDYEIYTPQFFEDYAKMTSDGSLFIKADSQYHFAAVVLLNKNSNGLHKFLYNHPDFRLAHHDVMCAVYERSKDSLDAEFSFNENYPQSPTAFTLSKLFNPFYQTYEEDSAVQLYKSSIYYNMVGDIQKSYMAIKNLELDTKHADLYAEGMGNYYLNLARTDTSVQVKNKIDSASMFFLRAIKLNSSSVASYNGLGAVSYGKGDLQQAVKWWEKALTFNEENLQIHLYLADCFEKLAEKSNASENYQLEIHHLLLADRLNPGNPFITTDLGFIYAKLNQCRDALPYLLKIKDFKGLSEADRDLAKYYISRCN